MKKTESIWERIDNSESLGTLFSVIVGLVAAILMVGVAMIVLKFFSKL